MRHSSVAHLIRNRRVACQARGEAVEIEREIVFPASPDEVWEALTEPERLEEWFASEAELDARPGGEGVFRWGDGEERRAVVREVDEAERLRLALGDGRGGADRAPAGRAPPPRRARAA